MAANRMILILYFTCCLLYYAASQDPEILTNPATCTITADCSATVPDSRCVQVAGANDADGNPTTELKCACITAEKWKANADQSACLLQSGVGELCFDARSECTDVNSMCNFDGSNTDDKRCLCKHGYITVYDEPNEKYFCGKQIDPADGSCDTCMENRGKCYDTDNDGVKDGCQCLLSNIGDDCETKIMTVDCTATEMMICYGPSALQKGVDFNDAMNPSLLFVEGHKNTVACVGTIVNQADIDGGLTGCALGNYYLKLSFATKDDMSMCGIQNIPGQDYIKRMETMVSVSRTDSEIPYQFDTYCAFKSQSAAEFLGVGIIGLEDWQKKAPGNDNGVLHDPALTLKVLKPDNTQFGEDPIVLVNDYLKFSIEETTDIYPAIRVQNCMLSTQGRVNMAFHFNTNDNTKQIIVNGCPVEGNNIVNQFNVWKMTGTKKDYLETGLIQAIQLPTSNVLFLHCTVKLCTPTTEDECAPVDCTYPVSHQASGRKKRAASITEETISSQKIQLVDSLDQSESEQKGEIGGLSTTSFTVVVALLVVFLLIFVIICVILLWRIKHKEAKVVDYVPDKPQRFAMPRMPRNDLRI